MRIKIILSSIAFVLLYAQVAFGSAGSVRVNVTGLDSDEGTARIAIVDNPDDFKNDDAKPLAGFAEKPSNGAASCTFKEIPYGVYAIKVYHDSNDNGVLDKGAFGIPKEQYGFSNTPKSKKGKPAFDKAKFTLDASEITIPIEVK